MSTRYRAILTGASGGIGRAIAQELAPQCDWLLLVGRDAQALQALAAQLANPGVQTLVADVTDPATGGLLAQAAQAAGGLNLLINNAGVSDFRSFASLSGADMERALRTNLLAPMQLSQALLPVLHGQAAAQIVNVGSIFGYIGFPGYSSYCASKFGLRGFSQALRRELADTGVRVKYFAPRATRTAINTDAVVRMNEALGTAQDSPQDVARELVQFLGSQAFEKKLGWPERFFVLLNQLSPSVPDKAMLRQLPVIRRFLP
jgi:short-subunit dehydrogenase